MGEKKLMVAMVTYYFQVYQVLALFRPSNIRSPWSGLSISLAVATVCVLA
jgi:hypothetical protein